MVVLGDWAGAGETRGAVQRGAYCAQHAAKGLAWDCHVGTKAAGQLGSAPQAVGAQRDALHKA